MVQPFNCMIRPISLWNECSHDLQARGNQRSPRQRKRQGSGGVKLSAWEYVV